MRSQLLKSSSINTSRLDDPCVSFILEQVPKASELPHSGRSFIEHLVGTWWILNQWNRPKFICRAGLLHSCYATSFYPHALFNLRERSRVRAIIGSRAETLAYYFCVIDRAELWSRIAGLSVLPKTLTIRCFDSDRRLTLSKQTVRELLLIECANLAEQSSEPDGFPAPWMSRVISWSRLLKRGTLPLHFHLHRPLTAVADRRALERYRRAMSAPAEAVCRFLDDVIRLNPWAGEPRLLRALCFLQSQEKERAFSDAMQGHSLLSAWAVPWDKRWSLSKWLSLSTAILNNLITMNHRRNDTLTLDAVRTTLWDKTRSQRLARV